MENVLRLRYRPDLDMPDLIRPETYRKVKSNIGVHSGRIGNVISKVEDASGDNSAVHLDFCFTGYYPEGKHYILAVWPEKPPVVRFNFNVAENYDRLFREWTDGLREGKGNKDPEVLELVYSHRIDSRRRYYMFFRENPHLPHRPYFFTRYDEMFSRQDQDDEKVIAFHKEPLISVWNSRKRIVEEALKDGTSINRLLVLEQMLRTFHPEEVSMFSGEERIRNIKNK